VKRKPVRPGLRNHGYEGLQRVKGRVRWVNCEVTLVEGIAGFLEPATSAYTHKEAIRLPISIPTFISLKKKPQAD
jgi:hypothetical protein